MKIETFDNVWDAIEDTPGEAANMDLRCQLMFALEEHIKRHNMSQKEAAKLFGVTQPRISDLVRGKFERFGIDMLVNMAATAGMRIELIIHEAKPREANAQKKTAAR
ncbi:MULTISPECIES: helix-turn-helix domain-containing protein [Paraburkholderia]|uniref:XRE-type DNA-binding protein n=1 Tax=Paraburkholderia tropica TaxID=92647 RepID=A0ABX5N078_9BURK|nr:XRE family transcriptional regulator [Paraburkholderia tropica]MBB2997964.1 putative XRE-type DNA-binding protein [Paraburkholderia tropica]MBB6316985.1 putative XRE-type DNA-binding protein [Paraburkholderia tropica]MDE1142438.1 XRE family transcriptional regulator [Paraburkholderia tropica]PXX20580.1 putative XRE-type DNA-binding protein [Paraburkholderia tropica]PZW89658.1 putative XRE-type DNA-binding protein [Paraburkholderia tropica]